jgi:heme/copper-type cytochrome/quinol oxidase subunit 3
MASLSENLPPGAIAPAEPAGVTIAPERHEISARALSVASRLLCGATTFFFAAFAFAYFYLRSLDQAHMWHPAHVNPSQGLGGAFVACVLLSALSAVVAGRRMGASSASWLTWGIASVVLGLAAVAVQCIEYTVQGFGPTNGAYASVFCAWSAFYLIAILAAMYWLETQLATEIRARRSPSATHGDVLEADRLIAPALDAAVFYWSFLAVIGVATYVVLYLV